MIYNENLKTVWPSESKFWSRTEKTYMENIQTFQNKVLQNIIDTPWYFRNQDTHRDLKILTDVKDRKKVTSKYEDQPRQHVNAEALQHPHIRHLNRRLRRWKPFELVYCCVKNHNIGRFLPVCG